MEEEGFKVTDRRHRDAASGPEPKADPPDLSSVFVMFASWALIGLGEAPDPATGQRGLDLPQARDAIETLRLLREKTVGNRTEPESRLLEELLYDVQMRYVRVAKTAGG
jgi:hypothetical protein